VLEGEITVSDQEGVTLSGTGQGTDIPSPLDPGHSQGLGPGENCPRHCHHELHQCFARAPGKKLAAKITPLEIRRLAAAVLAH